jgi:hypothetical protein
MSFFDHPRVNLTQRLAVIYKMFEQFLVAHQPEYSLHQNERDALMLVDKLEDQFEVIDQQLSDDIVWVQVEEYLRTKVLPHKIAVAKAFDDNRKVLADFLSSTDMEKLAENIIIHDLSKFSAIESYGYAQYKFGQPNSVAAIDTFEAAWHHHKMHNPHHPEYWLNPGKSGSCQPVRMPDVYIAEMICDWIGAGASYGNPFESWAAKYLHEFTFNTHTAGRVVEMLEAVFPQEAFKTLGQNVYLVP